VLITALRVRKFRLVCMQAIVIHHFYMGNFA